MAGNPSKRDPGRPLGSFKKNRNYDRAVTKMRALLASGVSERTAAEIVGEDEKIPSSTLRKHLAKPPQRGIEFDVTGLEVRTKAQVEESVRLYYEKQRLEKEEEPPPTKREQQMEMLYRLGVLVSPPQEKRSRANDLMGQVIGPPQEYLGHP